MIEDDLIRFMRDLDEDRMLEAVVALKREGYGHFHIMNILNRGMLSVGEYFESGEYYLADLIVSGILYRKALDILNCEHTIKPPSAGRILIGVVKNDIHDIGKDIVTMSLRSEGYDVEDLGIDVESQGFVNAAKRYCPDIIALSGTMGSSMEEIEKTIECLEKENLRDFFHIIVGGNCMTQEESDRLGADGFCKDPIEAVNLCRKFLD